MVCQIKFTGWTRDDRLPQPVFLGIREDKNANEVIRKKGKLVVATRVIGRVSLFSLTLAYLSVKSVWVRSLFPVRWFFVSGIWRGSRRPLFFQPFTDRLRILPEI